MRIGIFDSGIGGMTVLNFLKTQLQGHSFLYFGDTANVPYGSKSVAQIKELVSSAALRIKEKNIDALVVACNTASSLGLNEMQEILSPIPVIGVVEAGVQSVLQAEKDLVLILGTRATIQSKIYSKLLHSHLSQSTVCEQACPLLVPMIEEGWVNHPILQETIREYVKPYAKLSLSHTGVALLACTHYPWIKDAIQKELPGWLVIDSAEAICNQLKSLWEDKPSLTAPLEWYFSDPDAIASFVQIRETIQRF